jgi:hypothetical protein
VTAGEEIARRVRCRVVGQAQLQRRSIHFRLE